MAEASIVVGAGGGIGAACAVALAAPGTTLLLVDRDPDALARLSESVEQRGAAAALLAADAGDEAFANRVTAAVAAYGPVRAAVYAVAHEEHGPAIEATRASVERSFRVGPLAALSLFTALARSSGLAPGAALTAIGSLHARHPFADTIGYNLAHAALAAMVSTLAHEWAPQGIRVNAVVPGWTLTPGEVALYGAEHLGGVAAKLPLGRFAAPEDIARAVAFVSSPESGYVSGSFLSVDGALGASLAVLPGGDAR